MREGIPISVYVSETEDKSIILALRRSVTHSYSFVSAPSASSVDS